jgi:hypothetical protein
MRRRILWAAAGGSLFLVGLLVGLIASGGLPVFARGGQPHTHAASQPKQAYCDLYLSTLAGRLGVSVDKLEQSNADALTAVINQAAADGKLTSAQQMLLEQQVNKLRSDLCAQLNQLGKDHGARLHAALGPVLEKARATVAMAVADKLHLTPQALGAQLAAGKCIPAIAGAQHVPIADVNAAYLDAVKAQLAQAVSANLLTQQQSDKIYALVQQAVNHGRYPLLDHSKHDSTSQQP